LCSGGESSENVEWKVKRRSDGSRYITRRPVRNRLLKERALKLTSERAGISSTDDDAMSELKIGRYWNRDERKKHLEHARERKRRQEELLQRKLAMAQQSSGNQIVELSQKKMARKKDRFIFDDFITIQELLAHKSKESCRLGLLSVTTV